MKTNLLIIGMVLGLIMGGAAVTASATVLDFEDLDPGAAAFGQIPPGYGGFTWSPYSYWVTKTFFPGSGYDVGTLGNVAVYSAMAQPITLQGNRFDFQGAYITSAWNPFEMVTIEGWRDGVMVYGAMITTYNNAPYWFPFDFQDIDVLVFRPSFDIVIDNLTYTTRAGAMVDVSIDVKPGSDKNPVNISSKGVTPVAILTTDTFYAPSVDAASVVMGPASASPVSSTFEDVDGDGDYDLLLHFRTQEIGLTVDDTEVTLSGLTYEGTPFEGSDSITIKLKKAKKAKKDKGN